MVKRYSFNGRLYVSLDDYAKAVKGAASLSLKLNQAHILATEQAKNIREESKEKILSLVRLLEKAKTIFSCDHRLALLAQHRMQQGTLEGAEEDLGVLIEEYLGLWRREQSD